MADRHLLDWIRIVYRRRWIAAAAFLIVVTGGAWFTFTARPVYEAQAKILIESDTPNVVSFEEVLDEGQARANYYQTQYELLKSRTLAQKVVDGLGLWSHPDFGGPPEHSSLPRRLASFAIDLGRSGVTRAAFSREPEPAPLADDGNTREPGETPSRSSAISALLAHLQISPVRGSRIVNVRFRALDPKLAADVANAHVRQYIEQSLDLRFVASNEATDWLGARLTEERQRVEQSESALQAYREEHDAVSLEAGQDIIVQKLADLNAAVTRAKTNRIEKEARYRQLVALWSRGIAGSDSVSAILSNPLVQQLKVSLAQLQREYAQLSETLGDRHPTLTEKRSAIEATERRLQAETDKIVKSLENEYLTAVQEEASLTLSLEQQKQEALALNRRGIEYGVLKREADSVRQVYESLLQRAKETSVSRELRASSIRVIDLAEPPQAPISPRKGTNLLLALLGGSVLALGVAFGAEYVDDRIKTPDGLKAQLGVAFLALIPEVSSKPRSSPLLHKGVPSSFREAVRRLRTNLLSSGSEGSQRSIVVVSAAQGEGKTVVASNLAIALAQTHQRVLLLDGDMRQPGVHETFGHDLGPGLSDLLVGHSCTSSGTELDDVLHMTAVPGLTLMAAGALPPNAPDLLGSQRFKQLLDGLQRRFDWVIIDSPPVLAVTDAAVMARCATGAVLVVGAGMTGRDEARLALDQLERGGGRCIGAVLNRADLDRHAFYFAAYRHREYGLSSSIDAGENSGVFDDTLALRQRL